VSQQHITRLGAELRDALFDITPDLGAGLALPVDDLIGESTIFGGKVTRCRILMPTGKIRMRNITRNW